MRTTTLSGNGAVERASETNQACANKEASTLQPHRWFVLLAKILLPGGLFALSLFGAFANSAKAQGIDPDVLPVTSLRSEVVAALSAPARRTVDRAFRDAGGWRVKRAVITPGDTTR